MKFEEDSEKSGDSQTLSQKRFAQDKKKQIERTDPSNEGKLDDAIKHVCEKLNYLSNYYTTSSCSGRIIVEAISTEYMALPIMDKARILVDDNYLKRIVKEANRKLERVWEKIRRFEKLI